MKKQLTAIFLLTMSISLMTACDTITDKLDQAAKNLSGPGMVIMDTGVDESVGTEGTESTEYIDVVEDEKETIELSADEYYVDFPLRLEDGRLIYLKTVPNLYFYPEGLTILGLPCLEHYTLSNNFVTAVCLNSNNDISEANLSYRIDTDYSFLNRYKEDDMYRVSEIEKWENGVVVYKVDLIIVDLVTTSHVLYYQLDEGTSLSIEIKGFLGDSYYPGDADLIEKHEQILEFYKTEENAIIVVDPMTTDVVVSKE